MRTLPLDLNNSHKKSFVEKIKLLLVFWVFWPGSMFVVGVLFESRLVPIFEHQSLIFMPGDLLLGVMFVCIISIKTELQKTITWTDNKFWWLLAAIFTIIIGYNLRINDITNYSANSIYSPTKILHDIVGYFVIPFILIVIGIPEIISFFIYYRQNYKTTRHWIILICAISIFLLLIILDNSRSVSTLDIEMRHPSNWQPLWETIRKSS